MTFSQFVASGETTCVRGAPVWPSSAVTGIGVFVPPVLALSPLQLVDKLLDGGGEIQVGDGELANCIDQALYGVVFFRGCHSQGVKQLSRFFCHIFAHLLLSAIVGDCGVFCEAGLASCELVQLLGVADCRAEIFLGWRLLAFCCGLLLTC